jgi:hypothetical protein
MSPTHAPYEHFLAGQAATIDVHTIFMPQEFKAAIHRFVWCEAE